MTPYPSIENLRPREKDPQSSKRGDILMDEFCSETVESLKDLQWAGYEKLDGTGVRIFRHPQTCKVVIRGRKEKSQLPPSLITWFEENSSKFEGIPNAFCLYGEGIGPGIQKHGERYGDVRVVAFDMLTHLGLWLSHDDLRAWAIGRVECPPLRVLGKLEDCEEYVGDSNEERPSMAGRGNGEGIICRPLHGLLDDHAERIIVKIKARDYR